MVGKAGCGPPRPYAPVVEGSPLAAMAVSLEGRVLLLNKAAEALLGVRGESVQGRPLTELLPALSSRQSSGAGHEGEQASGAFFTTVNRSNHDRLKLQVFRTFLPPTADYPGCAVYHMCDLSELEALSRRYSDLEYQFAAFVEESTDVYFLLRLDLQLLYVNPAVRTVFGFEPAEWLGRPLDLPVFLPSEEIRRIRVLGRQ